MLNCLFVGLGGFVGAALRYLVGLLPLKNPDGFPLATFIVNVVGALAIGCIALAVSKYANLDQRLILFLKVGICGGFTTFSTFSLETAQLIKNGSIGIAVLYVVLSVMLGITAAMLPEILAK